MNSDSNITMHRASSKILVEYLRTDSTGQILDRSSHSSDEKLTCQKWLRSTTAKRYSVEVLYGDLLMIRRGLRILDVGGGISSLTRLLAERHDYTLIDLMAHDTKAAIESFMASCPPFTVVMNDWANSLPNTPFDVIIAADLFPNVDQRLDHFLELGRALGTTLRLSLTWHSPPRHDLVRRVHGDEIMCMVGWTGDQIRRSLEPLRSRIRGYDPSIFDAKDDSIYPNGRQVCFASIQQGA